MLLAFFVPGCVISSVQLNLRSAGSIFPHGSLRMDAAVVLVAAGGLCRCPLCSFGVAWPVVMMVVVLSWLLLFALLMFSNVIVSLRKRLTSQ